jgi:hypothetical protein
MITDAAYEHRYASFLETCTTNLKVEGHRSLIAGYALRGPKRASIGSLCGRGDNAGKGMRGVDTITTWGAAGQFVWAQSPTEPHRAQMQAEGAGWRRVKDGDGVWRNPGWHAGTLGI